MNWSRKSLIDLGLLAFISYLWLYFNTGFNEWWQLASFLLMLVLLVVITKKRGLSPTGIILAGCLGIIGWLFITRIDPQYSLSHWRGLLLGGIGYRIAIQINWFELKYKYINGFIVLLLLIITLIFGDQAGGAKAWLAIGGFRFQPVELGRIFMLLFLVGYFFDHRELLIMNRKWPEIRYWGPVFFLMIGVFLFLAVQRDLGPALLFYCLFISFILYTCFNWYQVISYFLVTVSGVTFTYYSFAHLRQRVAIWLNPWSDPTGAGYQLVQGLLSINNGGLVGVGLGLGSGTRLPAVHTDYIFALISEELGFIGGILLLTIYLLLLYYGIKIARKLEGKSHLLAIGIVLLWGFQVFIVLGGILTLIPLSGMTLPFISYGSSSLVVNLWLLGMLTSLGAEERLSNSHESHKGAKKILVLFLAMFMLLGLSLGYWQLFRPDLKNHPHNSRNYRMFQIERGAIYDRNGEILAYTELEANSGFNRVYPEPFNLAHTVGYFHRRFGITGLESAFNQQLMNQRDLFLTLDLSLETKISQLMTGYVGAVIVIDPKTGELLAINSNPAVNGNLLDQNWESYLGDDQGPFFNRALSGRYPPGSVIKPLLLATAYQEQVTTPKSEWLDQGSLNFGEQTLKNYGGNVYGSITSDDALALSSNIVFGKLAAELQTNYLTYLSNFGIGEVKNLGGIPVSFGNLPTDKLSQYGWAQLGIGQGEILVTPLEMAVAISTIANGGVRMEPYLVKEVSGNWFTRKIWRSQASAQVITQHTAALVRDAMILAVEQGTAQAAKIAGIRVAGKTGTAENPHGRDHSWFVGFAPADQPQIAVVVIIEHGGAGSGLATEIGREIFLEAL